MLVAGGDPAERETVLRVLAALRADATEAGGEADIIGALRRADASTRFDLVLAIADNTGTGELAGAAAQGAAAHPPRLVLIAAPDQGGPEAGDPGIAAVLPKPIEPRALQDALAGLLARPAVAAPPARRTPRFDGKHVLLVEDNEVNQQIALEMLAASGVRVDSAGNGRAALEKLFSNGPQAYDLVLMDIQMPELGGHAATRRIRMNPLFAGLPVIAMTAHATADERAECLRSGMQDHIAKPIDPERFYQTLAHWFGLDATETGIDDAGAEAAGGLQAPGPQPIRIPGFNTGETLDRLGGDVQLYHRVLGTLVPSLQHALAQFDGALAAGDQGLAKSAVHSVRGMAANVGAAELADFARGLEQALKEERAQPEQLARFRQLVEATMQSVGQGLAEAAAAMPAA